MQRIAIVSRNRGNGLIYWRLARVAAPRSASEIYSSVRDLVGEPRDEAPPCVVVLDFDAWSSTRGLGLSALPSGAGGRRPVAILLAPSVADYAAAVATAAREGGVALDSRKLREIVALLRLVLAPAAGAVEMVRGGVDKVERQGRHRAQDVGDRRGPPVVEAGREIEAGERC